MDTIQVFKFHNNANERLFYDIIDEHRKKLFKKKNLKEEEISGSRYRSNVLRIKNEMELNYSNLDSFVVYVGKKGYTSVLFSDKNTTIMLKKGESIIIPTETKHILLTPILLNLELLEIYIE